MILEKLKKDLRSFADSERAKNSSRFFKTGKGEYGEGDKFLGIVVPDCRKISRKYYKEITLSKLQKLIKSPYHEERLVALIILVLKFQKGKDEDRKKIYDFYLSNTKYINNWDLVDLSAPYIIGGYLSGKDKNVLNKFAKSKNLWEKRIAMLGTFYFINKDKEAEKALEIAEVLLHDKHDLIHKAVGWMLREIGKNCGEETEEKFLKKHYKTMPRTMLRYAIEKFEETKRRRYIEGKI